MCSHSALTYRVSHRVSRWIEEGQIYLQPFFLALCRQAPRHSFNSAFFTANPPNIRPFIRRLIKPATPPPLQLPLNSIEYYKHLLASDSPAINTSPQHSGISFGNCPSSSHPALFGTASSIARSPPKPSSAALYPPRILSQRAHSASLPFPELTAYQVFATSLLCIWQAHWRTIFEHVPFVTDHLNTSIARSLARLDSEMQFAL